MTTLRYSREFKGLKDKMMFVLDLTMGVIGELNKGNFIGRCKAESKLWWVKGSMGG